MTKTGRWVLGCTLVIGALLAPAAFSEWAGSDRPFVQ